MVVEDDVSGLTVYLNRDGLNTVETDQTQVSATDAVEIVLENHGKPTHVHLHLDDDLATLGTIEDPHWFVPKGEWREVDLQLSKAAAGSGRLEITAGYGQEQEAVNIAVEPAEDADPGTVGTEAERIDTIGGTDSDAGAGSEPAGERYLPEFVDLDRLQNPVVLGTGGAFLFVLVLLGVVNPTAALAAGVGAVLVAVAVWSYVTEWDPRQDVEDEA